MSSDCGPQDFVKWAWAVVNRHLGAGHPDADDLVNEILIAMWRAEKTFDPDKGAKASWLVKAAEMRFRDLAFGHGKPFGHVSSRQRAVEEIHIERLAPAVRERVEPRTEDIADYALLAYHHGEIAAALDRLTPSQRAAAFRVMRDELMSGRERAAWSAAKPKLREDLEHLREVEWTCLETTTCGS